MVWDEMSCYDEGSWRYFTIVGALSRRFDMRTCSCFVAVGVEIVEASFNISAMDILAWSMMGSHLRMSLPFSS